MVEGYIDKDGLYCIKCPYCNKIIRSQYVKQAIFNFETHILYCKKKPKVSENE